MTIDTPSATPSVDNSAVSRESSGDVEKTTACASAGTLNRATFYIQILALALLIFGARLCLIYNAANSVPIEDEWTQFTRVFFPWLDGTLNWPDLFSPHNEHRIFFPRILNLTLFILNGQWDSIVGMVFTACLHTATAVILMLALIRLLGQSMRIPIFCIVALLWIPPYGYRNALWSYQSCFYFHIFFSVIALWGLVLHKRFTIKWWIGLFGAICAPLSLASGIITSFAVVVVMLYLLWVDWRNRHDYLPSLIACAAIVAICALSYRPQQYHESLRSEEILSFFFTFGKGLSWPYIETPFMGFLLYLPFAALVVRLLWKRRKPSREELALVVFGGWVFLHTAAIAYARSLGVGASPSTKYYDILAFGPLCNFLSFWIFSRPWYGLPSRGRRSVPFLAAAWTILLMAGLSFLLVQKIFPHIQERKYLATQQMAVCRHFLINHDPEVFRDVPLSMIPHPNLPLLKEHLEHPLAHLYFPTDLTIPAFLEAEKGNPSVFRKNGFWPPAGKYGNEDVLGSHSGARPGPPSNLPIGTFISRPILIKQTYLEIPVAGYLGQEGHSLYVTEAKIYPSQFRTYKFDLPRAKILRIRVEPAKTACDIVLQSMEIRIDRRVIPIPVTQPSSLELNRWMSFSSETDYGGWYSSYGENPFFVLTGLPELDFSRSERASLYLKMWVSKDSRARVVCDLGQGFDMDQSKPVKTVSPKAPISSVKGAGVDLDLLLRNAVPVKPREVPETRWIPCYVRSPGNLIRIIAIDNSRNSWFAFAMPRGVGTLTYFSRELIVHNPAIISAGVILLFLVGTVFTALLSPLSRDASEISEQQSVEGTDSE
ncbi:MAG: hypothetical protein ABIH23_31170 [bacterium]